MTKKSLPFYTLFILVLIISAFRYQGQLINTYKTNITRVILEKAFRRDEGNDYLGFVNSLKNSTIIQENPRVAWMSGLYIIQHGASYQEAKDYWQYAPEYSAKILIENSRKSKEKQEKMKLAQEAFDLDPSSVEIKKDLVHMLMLNQRWAEASHYLDELLAIEPKNPDLLARRGKAEYKLDGSQQKAEAYLLEARQIDPDNEKALLYLANYYRKYEDAKTIEKFLLQALKTSKTENQILSFNNLLIDHYLREDEFKKIPNYLSESLAMSPDGPWINSLAGKYYLQIGAYQEAVYHYQKAISAGGYLGLYDELGESYYHLGKRESAIDAYCQAIDYLDDKAEIARIKEKVSELEGICK